MPPRRATPTVPVLSVLLAAAVLELLGNCTRPPPASDHPDAATSPAVRAQPVPSRDAGHVAMASNSVPEGGPVGLPDDLELVAVGKKPGAKIIWLRALGSRMWVSGAGLDAYADGTGPLIAAPDMLRGLPYSTNKHRIVVAGNYPNLFALRVDRDMPCGTVDSPAVFRRSEPAWIEVVGAAARVCAPFALVPWLEGALVVDSKRELGGGGSSALDRGAGTSLTQVGPAGEVRPLNLGSLGVDPRFEVATASSNGTVLSLLGTMAVPGASYRDRIVVVRGPAAGPFETSVLAQGTRFFLESERSGVVPRFRASVIELGALAIVLPTPARDDGSPVAGAATSGDEKAWKGLASSVVIVAEGKTRPLTYRSPAEQDCFASDATALGDDAYVVVRCYTSTPSWLVRIRRNGTPRRVPLPALAKALGGGYRVARSGEAALPCHPTNVFVLPSDDLWVEAQCGGVSDSVPAVFRRGRPQEPVVLP